MNTIQQGIICLLKSATTGQAVTLPEGFVLEEALPQIKRHSLFPLAYAGGVACGIPMDSPAMQQLFMAYGKFAIQSTRQVAAIEKIYASFDSHGIDYMPVKGCNTKFLYPAPELRPMGDADILIRMEQYSQIRPLMAGLGFEEEYESNHELVWKNKQLMVELHKRLIPSYNKDYFSYYGDGWKLASRNEGTHWYMSHEDEFIYVFTHFAKHYRDGGIGCRHLLDLWVYLRSYPDMDWTYIQQELSKLQLWAFWENIHKLIDAWFCDGEMDARSEHIAQFIFDSGSWGQWKNHQLSECVKNASAQAESIGASSLHYRMARLFPAASVLSDRFPVLNKCPWLLPVIWVWRLFCALVFRHKSVENYRKSSQVVTAENISSFADSLDYVGLHFDFPADDD